MRVKCLPLRLRTSDSLSIALRRSYTVFGPTVGSVRLGYKILNSFLPYFSSRPFHLLYYLIPLYSHSRVNSKHQYLYFGQLYHRTKRDRSKSTDPYPFPIYLSKLIDTNLKPVHLCDFPLFSFSPFHH